MGGRGYWGAVGSEKASVSRAVRTAACEHLQRTCAFSSLLFVYIQLAMFNFQKVSEWLRGALKLPQTTAPSTPPSQLPPSPLPPNTIQKAQNKRQRTLQILQQARDCKAQKRDAEQEATNSSFEVFD